MTSSSKERYLKRSLWSVVVVMLPDPIRGMGAWRNSTETQQSGHAPRSRPEVKNGRSSASRRRWVGSCRGCPQAIVQLEEFVKCRFLDW